MRNLTRSPADASTKRIPLWLKVTYTAFMAVLIPVYWINYGPTNFLYFCDVALLITLYAVWAESRQAASIAAVEKVKPFSVLCLQPAPLKNEYTKR